MALETQIFDALHDVFKLMVSKQNARMGALSSLLWTGFSRLSLNIPIQTLYK